MPTLIRRVTESCAVIFTKGLVGFAHPGFEGYRWFYTLHAGLALLVKAAHTGSGRPLMILRHNTLTVHRLVSTGCRNEFRREGLAVNSGFVRTLTAALSARQVGYNGMFSGFASCSGGWLKYFISVGQVTGRGIITIACTGNEGLAGFGMLDGKTIILQVSEGWGRTRLIPVMPGVSVKQLSSSNKNSHH